MLVSSLGYFVKNANAPRNTQEDRAQVQFEVNKEMSETINMTSQNSKNEISKSNNTVAKQLNVIA